MTRTVSEPTTKVVGPLKRSDQRDELHTQAAMGGLGRRVQERWISESVDPFRRIFYPDQRPQNVPMRSWRSVADGPLNPRRTEVKNPKRMSEIIKAVAKFLDADLVGICELNQAWVFTHRGLRIDFHKGIEGEPIELQHKYAISIAVEMEYENYANSPSFIDNAATGKGYLDSAKVVVSLAAWIREIGWPAKAHFFISEEVIHIPIAVEAGIGELARNGNLITRKYGPRVRLATVTTDLPLEVDSPVDVGVQAMCTDCNKCAVNCPVQCIPYGDKVIEKNVEKWAVDNVKCMKYWTVNRARFNDCARCFTTCVWKLPNTRWARIVTWGIPKWHWWRKGLVFMDDLIRGKKPNPKQEWLYYKVPGSKENWTFPEVIE
ncbi:hypothetical protein MYX82_08170 [Acidobacteria bacterium AH-259-D05]|nr:hypothetical protein [Acidobacteria bacterium AH-259-D05]